MESLHHEKIQIRHPSGKKAVSMDKDKYDTMKKTLLNCMKTKGELTHNEILKSVTEDFKKNKTKFNGSIEWHMEWVKLDLEARKQIKRLNDVSVMKFIIA